MDAGIRFFLFAAFALPITLIDLRERRIPDLLSLGGTAVFIAANLLWRVQPIGVLAARFFLGFGLFWLIWRLTRGGIGLGDAKFSGFIAVALGVPLWLAALLVAAVVGLAYALVLIGAFKSDRRKEIPFAPFLTAGAFLAVPLSSAFPQVGA